MNNSAEDKIWTSNEETRMRENVGNSAQFSKKMKIWAISKYFGNGGGQITLPELQNANIDEKVLRNVELGMGRRRHYGLF